MESRQKSSPRVKWTVAYVTVMGFLAALVTQSACTPVLPDGASAVGPPYMTDNGEVVIAMNIQEATTDDQILSCWDVAVALRSHLIKEQFLPRVREQQKEGYHLLYIANKETGMADAMLGYRINNYLWSGKTLYIDDLSTLPSARGRGYGGALLDYVKKLARDEKLDHVSLDSGYTRLDAHRLYLNKGFVLASHHFSIFDVSKT